MDDSQEDTAKNSAKLDSKRKSLEGRVRKDLITFVKLGDPDRSFARYTRLATKFKLRYNTATDRKYLDSILGDICRHEHAHGRAMLSVVVVNEEFVPGPGFFGLAKELGRQKPGLDDNEFIARERAELFEYWRTHKYPTKKEKRGSRSHEQ